MLTTAGRTADTTSWMAVSRARAGGGAPRRQTHAGERGLGRRHAVIGLADAVHRDGLAEELVRLVGFGVDRQGDRADQAPLEVHERPPFTPSFTPALT